MYSVHFIDADTKHVLIVYIHTSTWMLFILHCKRAEKNKYYVHWCIKLNLSVSINFVMYLAVYTCVLYITLHISSFLDKQAVVIFIKLRKFMYID